MTANRLLRMVLNRLLRAGAKRSPKKKGSADGLAKAQKSVRMINRIRRM
jgi:hypothetical protein